MESKFKTIDEYIENSTKDVQKILQKIRFVIRRTAPNSVEAISYQMPTFKLNGKNLVHFAAWRSHIGFYPTPSATESFKKELSTYSVSKGSIKFPTNQPIPYQLIKKIVKFRIKEIKNN